MDKTNDQATGRWITTSGFVTLWTALFTVLGILYLAWLVLAWSILGPVPAPVLLAPANGATLTRDTAAEFDSMTLRWSPVHGAARYVVEIQNCDPAGCDRAATPWRPRPTQRTTRTSYAFGTLGGGPERFRWQVWAVNVVWAESAKTDWWEFERP